MVTPKQKMKQERLAKLSTPSLMSMQAVSIMMRFYGHMIKTSPNGTGDGSTFSPSNSCTRAQFVTFLWRMAGEPKPESSTTVFTDISSSEYYNDAVLWAYENGITNGTSTTTFSPNASITRAQAITCLYLYAKCPAVSGIKIFADVNTEQYYATAVQWAAEQGITNGTSDTTFSPEATGMRGQMVTFLYRYKVEPLSK